MIKFKVGDTVKLIDNRQYSPVENGAIGIITNVEHGSRGWLTVDINYKNAPCRYGMSENDERWELLHQTWKERLAE